jgi:HD-GYP domain-containing protein (c-di-GMP phosphodiesterase class II)
VVRGFIALVTFCAVALFAVARVGGSQSLLPSGAVALVVPVLVAAVVVAQRFRLHLTFQTKIHVDTTVLIAAALLLDVPTAMAVVATASVIAAATAWSSWEETIFNAAQTALAVGAASTVFHALRAAPGLPTVPALGSPAAVLAGCVTLLLVNTWTVATITSFGAGTPPFRSWLRSLWLDTPENVALSIVGVGLAIVALERPWALPIFAVPVAVIYGLLQRGIHLRTATSEAIDELAAIVDQRDPYKRGRAERVANLARRLALRLDLATRDVEIIAAAARVLDIGMVAIDPRFVAKPTCLTPAEWDELRRHPIVGAELLSRFPHLAVAARAVRHHHERWDGTGYPDGIAGETIPLAARLIAVVDGFEAMTHARPHRLAHGEVAALDLLEAGAGHQWDPRMVEEFVAMVRADHVAADEPAAPPSRIASSLPASTD